MPRCSGSQFSRFLILQLSTSSKLISSPRREIFLLQVWENSCTQPELQPASFLMRSARRPNASLTYSNTLGSAPCARRELLKLSHLNTLSTQSSLFAQPPARQLSPGAPQSSPTLVRFLTRQ